MHEDADEVKDYILRAKTVWLYQPCLLKHYNLGHFIYKSNLRPFTAWENGKKKKKRILP